MVFSLFGWDFFGFHFFVCFEKGGVPLRDHDPGSLFCPGRLSSFQAKGVIFSLKSGRIYIINQGKALLMQHLWSPEELDAHSNIFFFFPK